MPKFVFRVYYTNFEGIGSKGCLFHGVREHGSLSYKKSPSAETSHDTYRAMERGK